MTDREEKARSEALLDQQRVLAEFGEAALRADELGTILQEACRLVGRALRTDLAKVIELLPDGRTMLVRAGVGWRPGVVNELTIAADANTPEYLTLKEGAVISPDIHTEKRFRYHQFLRDHGVQAFVNVLILSGSGPPFGVLQVDSRSPRAFGASDIAFLRTYANLLGAAIDRCRVVAQLWQALQDKDLLINELNHRVKNTLATVQSITFLTVRNAPTPKEAIEGVEHRLRALARAHDVLTQENWEAANVREIVALAVEPYRSQGEDRIQVRGSPARLPPRMALALAMALQELATNAVKHGALSDPAGGVQVHWDLHGAGAGAYRLHLRWEERGGPPVSRPRRRGFGTRLIEHTVKKELDGEVRIDFEQTGLVCELRIPLQDVPRLDGARPI